MIAATAKRNEPGEEWRRRLYVPNYLIGEAARYAQISPNTVAAWHKVSKPHTTLSEKRPGEELSYMQLIEVAVVAAFRKAGLTLRTIREAREWCKDALKSEFPFAEYRFKKYRKRLVLDYESVAGDKGKGKLLEVNRRGQFAWEEVIRQRLREFEYEDDGVVVSWHLRGRRSPILIDPRIAFGAPVVMGTPTWVLKGRWTAGESIVEISDDFDLDPTKVRAALKFEDARINN